MMAAVVERRMDPDDDDKPEEMFLLLRRFCWWLRIWVSSHPRSSFLKDLGLLGGLDDDAVGGVVQLPGNDT